MAPRQNSMRLLMPFDREHVEGQVLRVLDGVWKDKRTQLELKAWTEVFVVKEAP